MLTSPLPLNPFTPIPFTQRRDEDPPRTELLKMDPETYGTDSINPLPTDGENIPFGDQDKYEDQRSRTFNGLSAKEWAARSRSVWNDVSYVRRTKARLDHGATFPEALAQRIIEMYSKGL